MKPLSSVSLHFKAPQCIERAGLVMRVVPRSAATQAHGAPSRKPLSGWRLTGILGGFFARSMLLSELQAVDKKAIDHHKR